MNKWMAVGRLTKDPELKSMGQDGSMMAILSIAVRQDFKNKKTQNYESDFFMLKAFSKTAEYISVNISKGDLVSVEVSIRDANWEKDGEKQYSKDYVVNKINREARPNKPSGSEGF